MFIPTGPQQPGPGRINFEILTRGHDLDLASCPVITTFPFILILRRPCCYLYFCILPILTPKRSILSIKQAFALNITV